MASRLAGVAESDVAEHVERAADEAEEALKVAHQHIDSKRLRIAVRRLALDAMQLLAIFPEIRDEIFAARR